MSEQTCPACGERNAAGTPFCASCGSFLEWDEPEPPAAIPSGPPAATSGRSATPAPKAATGAVPAGTQAGPNSDGPTQVTPGPAATPVSPARSASASGRPSSPAVSRTRPEDDVDTRRHTAVNVDPVTTAYQESSPVPTRPTTGPPEVPAAPVIRLPSSGPRSVPRQPPPPADDAPTAIVSATEAAASSAGPGAAGLGTATPVVDGICPSCGTRNEPERRFCRKCGRALFSSAPATTGAVTPVTAAPPRRTFWWSRSSGQASAKRAYRASTPMRYRVTRAIAVVVVLGLIGGLLALLGQNPIQWVADRWADLRGTLVTVDNLAVLAEPTGSAVDGFPAANAVDGLGNTAWAVRWGGPPGTVRCIAPSDPVDATGPGALLVLPPEAIKLRSVVIASGLSKDDVRRTQQWRPKTLQLAFSDGTCQRLKLEDTAAVQQLKVTPVLTNQIRVTVVEAFAPTGPPQNYAALSEIRLLTRPNKTA